MIGKLYLIYLRIGLNMPGNAAAFEANQSNPLRYLSVTRSVTKDGTVIVQKVNKRVENIILFYFLKIFLHSTKSLNER